MTQSTLATQTVIGENHGISQAGLKKGKGSKGKNRLDIEYLLGHKIKLLYSHFNALIGISIILFLIAQRIRRRPNVCPFSGEQK